MAFFHHEATSEPEPAQADPSKTIADDDMASGPAQESHLSHQPREKQITEKQSEEELNKDMATREKTPATPSEDETDSSTERAGDLGKIDDDNIVYPSGPKLAIMTLALCLSVFLVALDNTIIATAIPRITGELNPPLSVLLVSGTQMD